MRFESLGRDTPVIFLDIDGVLACDRQFFTNRRRLHSRNPEAADLGVPYLFDPGCVARLNQLVERTGAAIVLTSDWRLRWDLAGMARVFALNGVSRAPADATGEEYLPGLEECRAAEIYGYVDEHALARWVAIDDLDLAPFMRHGDGDRFFRTRNSEGLKQLSLAGKVEARLAKMK